MKNFTLIATVIVCASICASLYCADEPKRLTEKLTGDKLQAMTRGGGKLLLAGGNIVCGATTAFCLFSWIKEAWENKNHRELAFCSCFSAIALPTFAFASYRWFCSGCDDIKNALKETKTVKSAPEIAPQEEAKEGIPEQVPAAIASSVTR